MNRFSEFFKPHFVMVLCILLILIGNSGIDAKPNLKNVIIISVDTLRADHLSCYGYPINTSPNIDQFAKDGILFSDCFSLTPLTTPSFSTFFTSLPPYAHGAKRNGLSIYRNVKTIPFYLKRFGYFSGAFVTNWPLKKKLAGLHKDFNDYYEIFTKKRFWGLINSEGGAPSVTSKAIEWLEDNKNKRFFLWVLYTEPHRPYVMHEEFKFDYKKIPSSQFPPGTKMKRIKKYDSEIAYADYYIGKLLQGLKNMELYKDSLIIFHSDHGESFGEHDYSYHGRKLYNSTVHVPMIIKLPGNFKGNTKRLENISLLDIAPTIFSELRIPIPSHMKGVPLFTENASAKKRTILLETYAGAVHSKRNKKRFHLNVKPIRYALINGANKLIYNLKEKNYEFYNLKKDVFENSNLNLNNENKVENIMQEMKSKILEIVENISKYIRFNRLEQMQDKSISEKDLKMLKSLGYID